MFSIPVIAILANHFDEPSKIFCLTASTYSASFDSPIWNISLKRSKKWRQYKSGNGYYFYGIIFWVIHLLALNYTPSKRFLSWLYLIISKISYFSIQRCSIFSRMCDNFALAMWSAPCFDDFSTAPEIKWKKSFWFTCFSNFSKLVPRAKNNPRVFGQGASV